MPSRVFMPLMIVISSLLTVPLAAQNVERGVTYQQFEAQASRTTTVFSEASVVSTRVPGAAMDVVLRDANGRELASLQVDLAGRTMTYRMSRGASVALALPERLNVTGEWANTQLYTLWRERTSRSLQPPHGPPAFDGFFFRTFETPMLSPRDHQRELATSVLAVTTEFPRAIAHSERNQLPPSSERDPDTTYSAFTTRLKERASNEHVGIMQWFEEVGTLAWSFPGRTTGAVTPETLAQAHLSTWPFKPNPSWANVQAYAFFSLHGLDVSMASVVGHQPFGSNWSAGQRQLSSPSNVRRITAYNEVGCDGLHWLDDTIFRPCCDRHDMCYGYDADGNPSVPEPCTWRSWLFLEGWDCAKCNVDVIWCFLTGGGGTRTQDPYDQDPSDPCDIEVGQVCSAECWSCY